MPVLTLTSDIGQRDYLVGAIKGELLRLLPGAQLLDISHQLAPFNYAQAAYVCRNSLRHFPEHSYHLILVDLFASGARQLLLAYHQGQYILCADNGLLTMVCDGKPEAVIGLPLAPGTSPDTLQLCRRMGEAVRQLAEGEALTRIGIPDVSYQEKNPIRPMVYPDAIEGQIIHIDHFENVVVNITREDFEAQRRGRKFRILFKRDEVIDRISSTYADAVEGEKLALFNAAGYLEIAINKGNAAGLLGLQGYSGQQASHLQNRLFYQTVRVFFE